MQLVNMVRQYKPLAITLAIGDGANDVSMITAAHVGVGIKGVEGNQAARASDYSLPEFHHLLKLMLYYGRECYRKNTCLIIYNFYKNMVYVMPQFWLALFNQFSGQNMFDPFIFQMYNIAYASIPIMIYALQDEEYSSSHLTQHPHLYLQGRQHLLFNSRVFWLQVVNGVGQALSITLPTFFIMEQYSFGYQDGTPFFFWATGMTVFGAVVYVTNFKILLISNTYSFVSIFFIFGSIIFYYFNYLLVSLYIPSFSIYSTFNLVYSSRIIFFVMALHIFTTTILEMAFMRYQS